MTAEAIAKVVADLRTQRVQTPPEWRSPVTAEFWTLPFAPVIDATSIYRSFIEQPRGVDLYEDHPCIAPPWPHFVVGYVNEHGNTIVTSVQTVPLEERYTTDVETHEIEWDRVRWNMFACVFIGGRSPAWNGPIPTAGPLYGWRYVVYEDGAPADLRWVAVTETGDTWDMANLVNLGALNFLNCNNVEIVEPTRPRAEARRLARTGVAVHTINVFPPGRRTRSQGATGEGRAIRSVRGHFAHYGPDYNRGLLFGRYAGRFWIPQRAVADAQPDYELHAERGTR